MTASFQLGAQSCSCRRDFHEPRLVVVTGGPGAGKTAVLELAMRAFCSHVGALPEAAGVVFGGGFPRHQTDVGRHASQRAIYHVQRELERLVVDERQVGVALCDRGTLDGLAYWPRSAAPFWEDLAIDRKAEHARYAAVIHLQTPGTDQGYNHDNPLRIESAESALAIDARIQEAWAGHPNRVVIPSTDDFLEKASRAIVLLRNQLPTCCRSPLTSAG